MYRFTALTALVFSISVYGTPMPSSSSQCDTGKLQCCNSVQPAGAPSLQDLLPALLNAGVQNTNTPIGIGCTPINVGGVGNGADCTAEPVCCENNNFGGGINIGCSPVNSPL